jgi:hypothetical protein
LRRDLEGRIVLLETTIEDIVLRGEQVQEMSLKHARLTSETVEREISRLEKVVGTLETYQGKQLDEMKKTLVATQ